MKQLALDTSSIACTVALQIDDTVLERHEEQPREHTRLLMPMIRELLEEADVALSDLDHIVLGNGPGSFIGMRIAASVAQGLAHGAGLKIVPVSSLAAVAAQVFAGCSAHQVAVAQDAHLGEVYLGIFDRGDDDLPVPVRGEVLHAQAPLAELGEKGMMRRIAAGCGWHRYPKLMECNETFFDDLSDERYPRARYLLALAANTDAVSPEDIEPAYLRKKVAEIPGTPK